MEQASYSITFTGNFLQPLPHEVQWAHLRKLFPHATDAELLEFFSGRRLLLTHTDSELTARELVSVLGDHGLECEYARHLVAPDARPDAAPHGDAGPRPQPHVKLAAHLATGTRPAEQPVPGRMEPPFHPAAHTNPTVIDEDALTPRGRRWAVLAAIAVGALTVYSIWSSTHSTYGHAVSADNGEMIPSLCALHESTGWFSGHGTYSLACSASNPDGRYKLMVSCTKPDDLQARLAFYDTAGNPRPPAWPAAATGLPIQYRLADGSGHGLALRASAQSHIGTIEGLSGTEFGTLLANPAVTFSGAFAAGPITFQLEPARWYVNALIFSCQLGKQKT